jgi:DNA-binding NtrC family response regulator
VREQDDPERVAGLKLAVVRSVRDTASREVAMEGVDRFGILVGRSPAMQNLYRLITAVASSDAPVILEGESGTGKDVVAPVGRSHHADVRAQSGGSKPQAAKMLGISLKTLYNRLRQYRAEGHVDVARLQAVPLRLFRRPAEPGWH